MSVCPHDVPHPQRRSNRSLSSGGPNVCAVILAVVVLRLLIPAVLFADTNVFSPTVSYTYTDAVGVSPVVSYDYPDGVGASQVLSYNYPNGFGASQVVS